jgi:hypothetical protein
VAALAGVIGAPARAQEGDTPRGLGREERSAWLARSWRALPAQPEGAAGEPPRLFLEPGAKPRAALRWSLDARSSLSLRLRGGQVSLAFRQQF